MPTVRRATPELLRALVDPSSAAQAIQAGAQRRAESVWEHVARLLWGNLFHQGTVWQATARAVPFFYEILDQGPADDRLRSFVVDYLHHLARGYPEDAFPEAFDPDQAFADVEGHSDPGGEPDYEDPGNRGLIWARDSYVAVERGLQRVLPLMESSDAELAGGAIAIVASFPRQRALSEPALRRIIARPGHAPGRAVGDAAVSLAALCGSDARAAAQMAAVSPDPLTSLLGLCALVIADPSALSTDQVTRLAAPLGDLADARSPHAEQLEVLVGRCLQRVPEGHAASVVSSLCEKLQSTHAFNALALTASLLTVSFGASAAPSSAADLNELQRHALEAIRDHGAFKLGSGVFANYAALLAGRGIPDTQEALALWLDA